MRIELKYENGKIMIGAVHPNYGLVSMAEGEKLQDVVRALVSQFAELQTATIEALNTSGIIHYVKPEEMS